MVPIKIKEVAEDTFIIGQIIGFFLRYFILWTILTVLAVPYASYISAGISMAVPFIVRYYNGRQPK